MKQPACNLGQIVFTLWAVLICLPASVQAQYTIQAGDRVALEWNYNTSNGASNARDINNCNVVGERRPGQEGIARSSRTCVSLSGWNIEGWYFVNNSPQYGTTWTAERLSDGYRLLYPMPGIGAWPNVSTGNRSWRVRIFNDISVPVCSSPGGSIQGYKYLGSMGWTLPDQPVSTSSAVWWRVRWDDGTIGWSPDSVAASAYGNRPGVYFAWYNRETRNFQQGCLSVSPSDGLTSSGPQGGPFSPSSKNYTLTNTGELNLNWSVSVNCNWVSVSQSSGTLSPGQYTTVTVSLNSNANSLPPGTHTCTVSFTNTTNGCGNATREVRLTVRGDTTPPNLSNCRVSPSSICAGRTTTISANVTDSESGVAAVWADVCGTRVDMSPAGGSTYQGTYQAPCSTSDRSCNVIIYARDRANNQASCNAGTLSISGDRNPPTGSTCINPTSVGASGGTINLYANLEDACCGVDRAFARIYKNGSFEATVDLNAASGSTPCAHNYRGTYAIPANNTGSNINWEIEICGQDRAGNVACSNRYRLVQPPCIQVTPSGGANFHRSSNGTVNPPSFPYTITNAGTSEIQYRVSTNQNWLNISPTYGTLQGGRSVRIDLSVNNNAHNLSPGTYTATVTFRNTTTGCEENRTVILTVEGRNNTGTGRTHNPYWGARVKVTLRDRTVIQDHNLVAYSDGKIYLHNPGGCSNNCQYESITVDSTTGGVTVHPEKAISIEEVRRIEVVNPGGFSVRTYGGVNKYIVKFSNENEYKSRAVELGNVRDADNTRCLLTEYSWNQLGYGVAYDGSTWYWWISDYSQRSCRFVSQSDTNIQELIAIPVAEVYPAGVNNNDIYNDVRQAIRNVGGRFRIPPHILYGIAWQESKWRQTPESAGYGGYDTRLTLISYDGGIGIMQITAGTVYNRGIFRDETTNLSNKLTHIYKLAKFPEYNIEAGARVLVEKAKDAERDNIKIGFGTTFRPSGCVLEHWYYPVWRYNGWTYEPKEFMCGEAAVDAPWRCPRSGNNMWLYPERIWAHIERRGSCRWPDWLPIPLGLGYPPTTDFPSDSSGSANDDCINNAAWRCNRGLPSRSKPTPFPANVDIDFNGTIDFVVEIPPGSSVPSESPDRCRSCGECNQVYVVCSSSDHCDPSSNSCYHICGKVYRYGYTRFSPSIVRLYSVSEAGGRIDSGVYSGEISYPPGGAIGEFDIAIPAIHMRCQQQQCKKVFRLEFWMDNPQEAPQPFFAVDLRVWLRGSGNFLGTRTISGHLILEQYQGSPPQGVEFVLRDPDTGEIVATHSDYFGPEGEFSIPAPAGRFELSVKVSHWLRRAVLVDTTLGDVEGLVLSLINGDANDDNVVDGEDLAMVVQNYGSSCWDDCPEGGLPGDLNGDLVVDDNDLLIVLFNFGQQGD
jgi:hypothetical protein